MTTSNVSDARRGAVTGPVRSNKLRLLTFRLGGETFAFEVSKTREVIDYLPPTQIPHLPPEVLGVINLRGQVVPVVDLRQKFRIAAEALSRESCIVMLEVVGGAEKIIIGALVDAVREVLEIDPAQIEPPPNMGTSLRSEYIRGMGKRGEEFMIILDVDRLFAAGELTGSVDPAAATSAEVNEES